MKTPDGNMFMFSIALPDIDKATSLTLVTTELIRTNYLKFDNNASVMNTINGLRQTAERIAMEIMEDKTSPTMITHDKLSYQWTQLFAHYSLLAMNQGMYAEALIARCAPSLNLVQMYAEGRGTYHTSNHDISKHQNLTLLMSPIVDMNRNAIKETLLKSIPTAELSDSDTVERLAIFFSATVHPDFKDALEAMAQVVETVLDGMDDSQDCTDAIGYFPFLTAALPFAEALAQVTRDIFRGKANLVNPRNN